MAHLIFCKGTEIKMDIEKFGVYLIDFSHSRGGELSGKHYAIAVTVFNKDHKTFVVVPITSKKSGKKYRGGFTIDCKKYQNNPSKEKAFAMVNKIREVSMHRVYEDIVYKLDDEDIEKLKNSMTKIFDL